MQVADAAGTAAPELSETLERDLAHILDLYREAGRKIRAGDPADWAAHLPMPQLKVLFYLGRYGALSVGEVAAGVGVSQPSATETLDKLVRAGLAERTPDCNDRRVVRSTLTPAGRDMIERPWESRRATLAGALRHAAPHERAAIAHGLALLCTTLERAAGGSDVATNGLPADANGNTNGNVNGNANGNVGEKQERLEALETLEQHEEKGRTSK